MDYDSTIEIKEDSYRFTGECQNRQGNEVIPLLIGGYIAIHYMKPEEEQNRWGENDHSGPQAA